MKKEPGFYIENQDKKWQLPEQEINTSTAKHSQVLQSENVEDIKTSLSDLESVRLMAQDRSNNDANLLVLQKAFDFLLLDKFGPNKDLFKINSEELIQWLQKADLPEAILNNDMSASYHTKNDLRFFRMLTVITENKDLLADKSVFPRALHDLATWEAVINHNQEKSLENNKIVVAEAKNAGDLILEIKARAGITTSKNLKSKDRASDYLKHVDIFNDNGASIEATRVLVEAARSFLLLAKGQWGDSAELKIKNLERAEKYAQNALAEAIAIKYSNAIYQANMVLSEIYREIGDKNGVERHLKLAEQCKSDIKS